MNKRDKKALLKKMAERVDDIHEMFRPDLRLLDLKAADEVRISSAIYDLTEELRDAIISARENV